MIAGVGEEANSKAMPQRGPARIARQVVLTMREHCRHALITDVKARLGPLLSPLHKEL